MEYKAVVSSNINGVAYDAAALKLYVEFKGGSRYAYDGVPEEIYDDFLGSSSKGQYFADNIKGSYPYTRA